MIKKFLNKLYYFFEIFSNHSNFFIRAYIRFHAPSVKKEIEIANLSNSKKILHIGCGAIPYTSIILSNNTDADIVGIDYNLSVVKNAKRLVNRFFLNKKIQIKFGDGKTYDVLGFNLIIISNGIDQQDVVLKNVYNSVKNGTKIILRGSVTEKNDYLNSMIRKYSVKSQNLLLTQKSCLLIKK